jgi:chemotaxis protein methyltransferase CheR
MAETELVLGAISDVKYLQFADFLSRNCGIVLGENKQYLVRSRLSPLVTKFRFNSIDELLERTMNSHDRILHSAVIDAMTTNETLWFRDVYPFDILAKRILPEYSGNMRPIRIWSAASSSGQEPYSIAMTILEQAAKTTQVNPAKVEILGTDISESMLNICREGVYDSIALSRGLSPERKRMFFEQIPDKPSAMRVSQKVSKMVLFKQQNLLSNFAMLGKFDVIFCRNVLIYFAPEVKERIINAFAQSLYIGGYLFLGSSEYVNHDNKHFEMIRCNPGIVFRRIS